MKPGCFVTGTDTNVGKTVVSAVLTVGMKGLYWKPVQSGSVEGTDREFVGRWAGFDATFPELYVFPEPVSPHFAAEGMGVEIDMDLLVAARPKTSQFLVVEGAGGVLVPLTYRYRVVDFMALMGLPAVVVASTRLGTINHTLLTLEALKSRGLKTAGVVLVGDEKSSPYRTIEHFSGVRTLGHVPWMETWSVEGFRQVFSNLELPWKS